VGENPLADVELSRDGEGVGGGGPSGPGELDGPGDDPGDEPGEEPGDDPGDDPGGVFGVGGAPGVGGGEPGDPGGEPGPPGPGVLTVGVS
jgi:hypothetical protein